MVHLYFVCSFVGWGWLKQNKRRVQQRCGTDFRSAGGKTVSHRLRLVSEWVVSRTRTKYRAARGKNERRNETQAPKIIRGFSARKFSRTEHVWDTIIRQHTCRGPLVVLIIFSAQKEKYSTWKYQVSTKTRQFSKNWNKKTCFSKKFDGTGPRTIKNGFAAGRFFLIH